MEYLSGEGKMTIFNSKECKVITKNADGEACTILKKVKKGHVLVIGFGMAHVFDYQVDDNNTITVTTNGSGLHIQFGWGQVAGSGASSTTDAVTFPKEFTSIIFVLAGGLYALTGGTPATDITGLTAATRININAGNIATTGFTARLENIDASAMSATTYWGYSWVAIGTL